MFLSHPLVNKIFLLFFFCASIKQIGAQEISLSSEQKQVQKAFTDKYGTNFILRWDPIRKKPYKIFGGNISLKDSTFLSESEWHNLRSVYLRNVGILVKKVD